MGTELLASDGWEQCYEMMMALHFERAESEYLSGDRSARRERDASGAGPTKTGQRPPRMRQDTPPPSSPPPHPGPAAS